MFIKNIGRFGNEIIGSKKKKNIFFPYSVAPNLIVEIASFGQRRKRGQ
jgi:hypothetical protein